MAGETFKLNFITNGEGIKPIREPVGFDAADFTLKQDNKRLGRDVSFAGGESEFSFYPMNDHEFDLLVYYYETFGWEAEVQLIIEIDGFDNIIGDFDFFTAKTDLLEYFKCKIVQNKKQALIKKRNDVKVDLFADKDLDDNDIVPLTTENVLVKAKPIKQTSKWETSGVFYWVISSSGFGIPIPLPPFLVGGEKTEYASLFPCVNLVKYGVEDSLIPIQALSKKYNKESSIINVIKNDYIIVEALNNVKDITINITNVNFNVSTAVYNGGDGYVDFRFEIKYGTTYETAQTEVFFNGYLRENENFTENRDFKLNIPYLNRADKIWCYCFFKVRQSSSTGGRFTTYVNVPTFDLDIIATSTSYSTIAPSVRLHDAISQTVNSVSQLPISFPFTEPNGEMYNQRVLSGNMLRNILDKPFYFSMKAIEDWLPEINGDYEVGENSVYFGLYKDFYTNIESGVFYSIKFEDYEKMFNEKYAINQFNYKYNKFQSQKENDVENTYDVVHGESEWLVANVFVENKKEISVYFVRDAFMIAETQKKALTSSEDTATQDDDNIFIIDTIESLEDYVFQETDFIQHVYDEDNSRLELNNTGNFSFILIGITVGTPFKILGGDSNAGTYTVYEVTNRKLTLTGSGSVNNNGERITQFEYVVTKETAPFKTWGSEGFNFIDGINNTEDYANLRYSLKRNISRFYNQYLATANLWAKKQIKNTFYKNNPNAILNYEGFTTTESESFTPSTPILSTYKHKITLITDFATYKNLENKIRSERGFIRLVDKEDFVLKLYPQELTFVNSGDLGKLTIIGEEKYESSLINISQNELPYVTINDYYRTTRIKYSERNEKFYIFDDNSRLLFKPTFWHKITVNGKNANNKQELIEWLTLIS